MSNTEDFRLNNDLADEMESLVQDMGVAGDAETAYKEGDLPVDEMIKDYDNMRRAFQLLVVAGWVDHDKVIESVDLAKTLK